MKISINELKSLIVEAPLPEMADPELLIHPLFSSFVKGWSTRASGPVFFGLKDPVKVRLKDYPNIMLDILQLHLHHGDEIYISLQEEPDGDYCSISVKIEAQNGKQDIAECYDISLKIDRFFSGFEIND
jgi:hypothetical protein